MRRRLEFAAVCCLMLAVAGQARAGFVTVNFTADTTLPPFGAPFGITGTQVTGYFSYDTGAPDSNPSATVGEYLSGSASFTIGSTTVSTSSPLRFIVDSSSGVFAIDPGSNPVLVDNLPQPTAVFFLTFFPASLASDSLPGAAVYSGDPAFQFQILDVGTGEMLLFDAPAALDAEEAVATQEPSSLVMLGAGALFAGVGAIRRRVGRKSMEHRSCGGSSV